MVALGHLLTDEGRLAEAEEAYRRAISMNDPDESPTAMIDLGLLLEKENRQDEAEALFRMAMDSSQAAHSGKGMLALGVLLYNQGRVDEARACWLSALQSRVPDVSRIAGNNLAAVGTLHETTGEVLRSGLERIRTKLDRRYRRPRGGDDSRDPDCNEQ
jgi:tetratricopeptide (TPR) repeat protein